MPLLCACGIDAESPARFRRLVADPGHPMPFVFSRREIEHCRSLSCPEQGLCAAFCCKEAFFKALSVPYNYPGCEFLLGGSGDSTQLLMDATLMREHCLDRIEAQVLSLDATEIVVVVQLYSQNRAGVSTSAMVGRSQPLAVAA